MLKDASLWRPLPLKKKRPPTFAFELKRSPSLCAVPGGLPRTHSSNVAGAPPPPDEGADADAWRGLLAQPAAICAQRTVVKVRREHFC
jgi:hypothetical protein